MIESIVVDTIEETGIHEFEILTVDGDLITVYVDSFFRQDPIPNADNPHDAFGYTDMEITITRVVDGETEQVVHWVEKDANGNYKEYGFPAENVYSDQAFGQVWDAVIEKIESMTDDGGV